MVKILDSSLVGVYYMFFSIMGSMTGFSFSTSMSMELSGPFCLFNENFYYINVTSHGLVMVFFFLTLLASGFSNFFLPHMCFQEDMFLPSVNVFSLWLMIFSFMFLICSLLMGEGVNTGWTLYTPLSSFLYNDSISIEFLMTSMHLFSLSSMLGGLNMLMTVFMSLGYFSSILSLNPFVWSFISTSMLILFSTPSLSCVLTMLLCDSVCGSYYFIYEFGGDPMLYQMMFWMWGHPEVYMMILPVFGVMSQIMQSTCGMVFNSLGIIYSMLILTILSFLVWGHHMMTIGWNTDLKSYFMISTMIMSMPTSVKIFSWLFSLFLNKKYFSMPLCCFSSFLFFFSLGGISGLFLSNSFLDMMFHDSYFVVGHFHFVMSNAAMFGYLSGWFFFFSNFFNNNYYFNISLLFCSSFSFFLMLLFSPFHILGILGLPSSVCSYPFIDFFWFYTSSMGFMGVWINFLMFLMSLFILCLDVNFVKCEKEKIY